MKKKPSQAQPLLTLTVEQHSGDGQGIAHLPDGRVCFVALGLPGETVEARLLKVGKTAAWARAERVLTPSPARVAPDCPAYPACGGCRSRHMTYEEECAAKRQKVEDALRRIGGAEVAVSAILGAKNTERYRNKVQFPVGADGSIGFYEARSHRVVEVEDCLLQPESAARVRAAVKAYCRDCGVPGYDERTGNGLLRHLYLRFNSAGQVQCCLVVNGDRLPQEQQLVKRLRAAEPGLTGILLNENAADTNVVLGKRYRTLWGEDTIEETLLGLTFRLSPPSFFQVNRAQTEVLYETALSFAGLTGTETVLDLYCGIGTISLCLARKAGQVVGAEVVPEAVEDAKENARRNGISNARFFCGDAGEVASQLAEEGVRPQVVCVDPPRKGLQEDVPPVIAGMGPERIVYVSCDPATLARDVKRFGLLGYRPEKAVAVDLFPRTEHVETVCLLVRQEETDV